MKKNKAPLFVLFLLSVGFLQSCTQEQTSESIGYEMVTSSGPPDLSGIWQAVNAASWNLEGHTASKMPVTRIMGALGGIVGSIQANEAVKEIVNIGESLCGYILIIDALKLSFRKVKLDKRSDCSCNEK